MVDETGHERNRQRIGLVRLLLKCLLATLGLAAVLGLWGILADELDGFPLRVFLFSLATAGYSIVGLGCAVPLERDLWKQWASVGIAVTLLAYGLVVVLIFVEPSRDEEPLKWVGILTTWAVAFSHTSLLTLARLSPHQRHVRTGTTALVILLAMLLSLLILTEFDLGGGDVWVRVLAALGLLVAMGTLAVPILHRMASLAPEGLPDIGSIERVEVHCPRCHRRQFVFLGGDSCEKCSLRITVAIALDLFEPSSGGGHAGEVASKDGVDGPTA